MRRVKPRDVSLNFILVSPRISLAHSPVVSRSSLNSSVRSFSRNYICTNSPSLSQKCLQVTHKTSNSRSYSRPYSTTAIPNVSGPSEYYSSLVNSGRIIDDPLQRITVTELQKLYDKIKSLKEPPVVDIVVTPTNHSKLPPPNQLDTMEKNASLTNLVWSIFSTKKKQPAVNIDKPKVKLAKGLYLWGDVGTGKSMVMDIFYNSLNITRKERIHFHAFMQRIHGRIHSLRQQHHTSDPIPIIAQEIANKSWVLCFDELQVTDITDAMLLRRLFQELIDAGVVLVTTSNRPPDDLYKNGIQRKSFLPTIELLKNSCKVVELSGGVDYRKRSKEHMKVYFHPLSAESNNAIDTIWRRLTYQLEVAPLTLNYLGRSKTFQETAGGQILRITFAELCAQPASAADYLQLANQFQVVILTKIPQMNNLARNESRRFITLLDSLYENRRVLICEADKSMSELFDSGVEEGDVMTEEAFAFQRALSRLVEMQSMEWIGKEIMDRLDSPLV